MLVLSLHTFIIFLPYFSLWSQPILLARMLWRIGIFTLYGILGMGYVSV